MKTKLITVTLVSVLLSGCGGRTPAPVMVAQYGDDKMSCDALEYEMNTTQNEINRILPKTDKTGQNVALGVAGAFLLVPWFFMDFKNADATEYEALRQRYNHLGMIATDKHCGVEQQHYPTAAEIRAAAEKAKTTTRTTTTTSRTVQKR